MPPEIRFYHLTSSRLEQALPALLQRTLGRGWRAVVLADSAERVEWLNQHLWTFEQGSFLPHGSAKDGDAPDQPVWLTDTEETPNGAKVLFLLDGMACEKPESYDLVCTVFDGNDGEATSRARHQWKTWKDKGIALTYWQQGDKGWEQKA